MLCGGVVYAHDAAMAVGEFVPEHVDGVDGLRPRPSGAQRIGGLVVDAGHTDAIVISEVDELIGIEEVLVVV